MTVRTRQSYMDLCRSDRPWKGRDMADLVDKIYDVEERADRASKVNATKLVQAKSDGFDVSGEGFLQKREGKWILSEPDFLTEEEANKIYARIRHSHNEYALKRHAPTHHYGGADPLEGQEIHGLRIVDHPTFASITATSCSGIGTRPVVALADGTFDDQDAATFVGTIGAAASIHDHTSITGSAAKLTTARSIGMAGDGTWSVSFDGSANVSGAMTLASIIAAGGPVGSATKAPQFTWDSKGRLTAVDEVTITPAWSSITSKPTTFSGLGVTMLASDIPNHASRHHWDGSDPLDGQSIAGLRTTSSPTFEEITITDFAVFRRYFGSSTYSGLYPLGVTPSAANYVIAFGDNSASTFLNGGVNVFLSVNDASKVEVTSSDVGIKSGVSLSFNSIQTIDSSRNSFFNQVTATNLYGTGVRPTVATAAGLIQSQDAATFRTTIDAAARLHASTHYWNGSDPLDGQSIAGLRTTSSPSFYGIIIGDGGIDLGSLVGIGRNGSGGIYMRPSAGVVRLTVEDTNVYCSTAFSANSGQFTNLSTGFVRSNSVGQLSSSSLLASELPNHASRHHWNGADALAGQSINGLRSTDSPSFLNLNLGGALNFPGYRIITYDGDAFYVETSTGWQLIKATLAGGTVITAGLFPAGEGLECGKDGYRWNFRSNDVNHDCDDVTATNSTPGNAIQTIPSTGNYFRLTNGESGGTRNYRIPTAPGAGIGKQIVLFSGSSDPSGFTRIYPPSSGYLWRGGMLIDTYVEFASSLKIVMDSDGSNWYI